MWLWKLCNKFTDQLKQESIAHIRALPYYKLPLYSSLFPIVVLFEDGMLILSPFHKIINLVLLVYMHFPFSQ